MGLVYSTGVGRICPGCRRPAAQCVCKPAAGRRAAGNTAGSAGGGTDGAVRVGRQTQGRAGKAVTVISGLGLAPPELTALAGELKRLCGSGGTVRDGTIEIQGEHRDRLVAELTRRGLKARRAGG
jgi:translation initiation factor 1